MGRGGDFDVVDKGAVDVGCGWESVCASVVVVDDESEGVSAWW